MRRALADDRFIVSEPSNTGPLGTVAWLRSSVARFANGAEHERRLSVLCAELASLDPGVLGEVSYRRANDLLDSRATPGEMIEVMTLLARRVPMETLALCFGSEDPEEVAAAAIVAGAGYLPGCAPEVEAAADEAVAQLVSAFNSLEADTLIARITLLVQACEATAGLIGAALHTLQEAGASATNWPTELLLLEVVRHHPPVRVMRRVARGTVSDWRIEPAEGVICDIESANHDPLVFERPDEFDPFRSERASLTFGSGLRPCPGRDQALALAAGVVDAVRQRCTPSDEDVRYSPSAALRIPESIHVLFSG